MAEADQSQQEAREAALEELLSSPARLKLVVAGPGTGKTFAFDRLLDRVEGRALALTFLLSLVKELQAALGDRADVYSFHGFARMLLHQIDGTGVSRGVHYYPPFADLVCEDLRIVDGAIVQPSELGVLFRNLLETDARLIRALACGEYYDAVSYDDAVYRVLRAIEDASSRIPSYSQMVVDEYQDFCALETALIAALANRIQTLIAGDDDQALYAFRNASPDAIRALVTSDAWARFELPFCTRCTEVIVAATHRVVARATAVGLLQGRIEKRYECFTLDKRADSERFPQIIHAHCSTHNRRCPYISQYIDRAIGQISEEDIAASHEKGVPTALIIGPNPFLSRVEEYLRERWYNVSRTSSDRPELDVLYAYRLLSSDSTANLAWRILMQVHRPGSWEEVIRRCLSDGARLCEGLAEAFVQKHSRIAEIFARAYQGLGLTDDEAADLASVLGVGVDELQARLHPTAPTPEEVDEAQPTIMLTSLMGSKGLQAEHVFIIGVNEEHFPRSNTNPTNEEVCQFLVALTRARKSCTLVSAGRFGAAWLRPSLFVRWLEPLLVEVSVDKHYFSA
jgi:superfamily I DNA/RNA helicase